jgi:hypothetical protein
LVVASGSVRHRDTGFLERGVLRHDFVWLGSQTNREMIGIAALACLRNRPTKLI